MLIRRIHHVSYEYRFGRELRLSSQASEAMSQDIPEKPHPSDLGQKKIVMRSF